MAMAMATFILYVILMGMFLSLAMTMADINYLSNESSSTSLIGSNKSNTVRVGGCVESEKQALMAFKRDIIDVGNRLVSWSNTSTSDHDQDCCRWLGVSCDNTTGHVTALRLGLPNPLVTASMNDEFTIDVLIDDQLMLDYERQQLGGKINPSLFNLKQLRYLDLSNNLFQGLVPYQLGNLSSLQYLDLGGNYMASLNLQWLSGLPLLRHLDLSFVNLTKASDWWQVVNSLPSLEELYLSGCQLVLPYSFPNDHVKMMNLSSLIVLDLSLNNLTTVLGWHWLSNLNSLVFLNLQATQSHGPIPDVLRNMTHSLRHLDLSFNGFNSSIPEWLYSFSTSLEVLDLSFNLLRGEMMSSAIGNMTSLNRVGLLGNQLLEGKLPRALGTLCKLRSISMSDIRMNQDIAEILDILSSGCSAYGLRRLYMVNCHLFGQLTPGVGHFKNLTQLWLADNSISGPIPTSFGQLANLKHVDVGNNSLEGVVTEMHFANLAKLKAVFASSNSLVLEVNPTWIPPFQLEFLYLSSWKIGPLFPSWIRSQKHLEALDISETRISDSIPSWFWNMSNQISELNLSHNQIYGQIAYIPNSDVLDLSFNRFSGRLPRLISSDHRMIDLSNNYFSGSVFELLCNKLNGTMLTDALILAKNLLSGEIPDCWIKWQNLVILKLNNNRFNGRIPTSIGTLQLLRSLNLGNNNLHGKIPSSLKNCKELVTLNLGGNGLDGNIPRSLGLSLPYLTILSLRANKLQGEIPYHLCALTSLQILDLANNNLFGGIPRCISNFSAMVWNTSSEDTNIAYGDLIGTDPISESASVMIKGQLLEYGTTLNLVKLVDLSCNNLSGVIHDQVTSLRLLQSLNLSHNHFTGRIPETIGGMEMLESLDLSANQLSGSIPQSMSSMTFLNHLNLSSNNLTGTIPSSTQLQSFNASSYGGNHLCGPPLENCREKGTTKPNAGDGNKASGKGRLEMDWFYFFVSIAPGFVIGFWAVVGPLAFSRQWRFIYFRRLEQMWSKLSKFVCQYS